MCNGQCLTGCPYPDNPEKCKGGSYRSALPWRDCVLPNQKPTAAKIKRAMPYSHKSRHYAGKGEVKP